MSADELAAAVAELGALPMPVPVVPEPQALSEAAELAAFRALELGDLDGRVSASCGKPNHLTWLRKLDDTRACPWCVMELQNDSLVARTHQLAHYQEIERNFWANQRADQSLAAVANRRIAELNERIAELERTVQQMCDGLNGHDCPPPGETPMGLVTRFSVRLMEAERLLAEDGCSCPPVDRTHQVGCPLDGVPASGPDAVTTSYTATPEAHAQMRAALTRHFAGEPEPEFYGSVHHDWRLGRDLPELGGLQ